jgi:hypothetical protein
MVPEVDLELAEPTLSWFPLCWSPFSTFLSKRLPSIPAGSTVWRCPLTTTSTRGAKATTASWVTVVECEHV